MARRSLVLFAFIGSIFISLPGLSLQQQSGDSPSRFNPDSRPSAFAPTSSTPTPLDIQKQLESIAQQEEKLEQMKQLLLRQLDKFRDEYMGNILSSTVPAPGPSIILNTLRSTTPTTPQADRTTTRLMEIRESFMEIEVRSPPVLINRSQNNGGQLARS